MINEVNMLKSKETLISKMSSIIDAFVEFYGEENKEFITKKLNNIVLLTYNNKDSLGSILDTINMLEEEKLFNSFIEKLKKDYSDKEIDILIGSNDNFSMIPLYDYVQYKKGSIYTEFYKENTVTLLSKLYPDINVDNIEELEKNGYFSKLDKMISLYEICNELLSSLKNKYVQYYKLIEKDDILEEKIFNKYFIEYINSFSDIIPKEILESIDINNIDLPKSIEYTFGNLTEISNIPIMAFDKDNEEMLNSNHGVNKWKNEIIENDRIRYFKSFGIDLGDDYSTYINNEECKKLIPSQDLINRVRQQHRLYKSKIYEEYYSSSKNYIENIDEIKKYNLLLDGGFDIDTYVNPYNCVYANIKEIDGDYIEYPVVCIFVDGSDNLDSSIIHELNHVLESSIVNIGDDGVDIRVGWDLLECKYEKEKSISIEEKRNVRKYELFNEIINEIISQVITSKLHKKGNYIFNSENRVRLNGSNYDNYFGLVDEFLHEFTKEIIMSRRNNNINIIFEKVGKENFDALNDLFSELKLIFDEFGNHFLYALEINQDNEYVKKYNEIMKKKDVILENMRNYSNKKSKSV